MLLQVMCYVRGFQLSNKVGITKIFKWTSSWELVTQVIWYLTGLLFSNKVDIKNFGRIFERLTVFITTSWALVTQFMCRVREIFAKLKKEHFKLLRKMVFKRRTCEDVHHVICFIIDPRFSTYIHTSVGYRNFLRNLKGNVKPFNSINNNQLGICHPRDVFRDRCSFSHLS